jgi:hypothetical protein
MSRLNPTSGSHSPPMPYALLGESRGLALLQPILRSRHRTDVPADRSALGQKPRHAASPAPRFCSSWPRVKLRDHRHGIRCVPPNRRQCAAVRLLRAGGSPDRQAPLPAICPKPPTSYPPHGACVQSGPRRPRPLVLATIGQHRCFHHSPPLRIENKSTTEGKDRMRTIFCENGGKCL